MISIIIIIIIVNGIITPKRQIRANAGMLNIFKTRAAYGFSGQSIGCIDIDNLVPSVISIQNSVNPSRIKKANENERAQIDEKLAFSNGCS